MSQFKRELSRERKTYSPNARKSKGDSMTDGLYGNEPFTKTTTRKCVEAPPMGVRPLPKIGDDLEGQLNADTRKNPFDIDKAPKIPMDQRRNYENNKRLKDPDYENVVNEKDTYGRVKHSVNRRAKSVD